MTDSTIINVLLISCLAGSLKCADNLPDCNGHVVFYEFHVKKSRQDGARRVHGYTLAMVHLAKSIFIYIVCMGENTVNQEIFDSNMYASFKVENLSYLTTMACKNNTLFVPLSLKYE